MKSLSKIVLVLLIALTFPVAVAEAEPLRGKAAQAQGPRREDRRGSLGNTSLTAPIALLSVGAVSMLVGGIVFASLEDSCDSSDTCYPAGDPTGKALMIGGAAVALVGLVVLPIRMVARRQRGHAMHESPYLTQRASFAPWITRRGSDRTSLGLSGSIRF